MQINQKETRRFKLKFLFFFFLFLFGCVTIPVKTYEETVSQWKSYEDVAMWMKQSFSYDNEKLEKHGQKRKEGGLPVNTPQETFELKLGICQDAARFVKEALNHIDPSYEAEVVFIRRRPDFPWNHYVCSFKKDGKLYIMDYGLPSSRYRILMGVHGPYNSLEEYKKFFEENDPDRSKVRSITFGWNRGKVLK